MNRPPGPSSRPDVWTPQLSSAGSPPAPRTSCCSATAAQCTASAWSSPSSCRRRRRAGARARTPRSRLDGVAAALAPDVAPAAELGGDGVAAAVAAVAARPARARSGADGSYAKLTLTVMRSSTTPTSSLSTRVSAARSSARSASNVTLSPNEWMLTPSRSADAQLGAARRAASASRACVSSASATHGGGGGRGGGMGAHAPCAAHEFFSVRPVLPGATLHSPHPHPHPHPHPLSVALTS